MAKEIQIKSDCKTTIEELLKINVRNLLYSLEKMDLVWCPWDCNESTHETIKWAKSVVKNGNGFLLDIPTNVESDILHDSFVTINE